MDFLNMARQWATAFTKYNKICGLDIYFNLDKLSIANH